MKKELNQGLTPIIIDRDSFSEIFITFCPDPKKAISFELERLFYIIKALNSEIIKFDIFCTSTEFNSFIKAIKHCKNCLNFPITCIDGGIRNKKKNASIQIHAVSNIPVKTIYINEKPLGRYFEDSKAKYCFLGNIKPTNNSFSNKIQAKEVFLAMQTCLEHAGMDITNIVRTWFYNNNILSWYQQFNNVRNAFFKYNRITSKTFPSSTGIGTNDSNGFALVASAIALQKKNKGIKVNQLSNHMQHSPHKYGSSFSRATEVLMPDYKKLFISGTASIDKKGNTAHIDDIKNQISHTMNVVKAILLSKKMSFSNIVRSIAYFKNIKDISAFYDYCQMNKLPEFPLIITQNDICRNDLLFEIEADAILYNIR